MAKHIISIEVAEKTATDVEFDPSEWAFSDIVEAFEMGLITAEVCNYTQEQTNAEQVETQRRLAAERRREREAMR